MNIAQPETKRQLLFDGRMLLTTNPNPFMKKIKNIFLTLNFFVTDLQNYNYFFSFFSSVHF